MAAKRTGPNLTKIAAALGVSSATVSNALSGKGRVSADLADKIRHKAHELGYVPSNAGRALRTGRSGVLGLVLPDIANPLFPQIAQAMEMAASNNGYGVLIADSRGEVTTQTDAISRLIERGVDGLIVIPRRGTRIGAVDCPVAMVDTPSTPGNTVSADHWDGGEQIARHLCALGHKKILLLGNDPASNVQNDRIGGMKSALGRDVAHQTIWLEPILRQGGTTASLKLPYLVENGVTAVATVSDLLALRVLTDLQTAGFRVPAQVSVTGFDDLVFSAVMTPALTTIHMNMAQIAEIAVAALIAEITGPKNTKPTLIPQKRTVPDTVTADTSSVAMELIIRSSTGPVPPSQISVPNGETL
jgi:LacI family transcriptional regulator|tara:strand:+ start:960 stop:2036 length:1077 start_codon:yes stop_codon:yes gene_type:complete